MKQFFLSLLSPTGDISLGSVCTFLLIFVYICLLVFAFFMEKKLPITPIEFTGMVGVIYGIKKAGTTIENYYQYKNKGGTTITLTRNSD